MEYIYVVVSAGGSWSNDDEAAPDVIGAYTSQEKATAAIETLMRSELEDLDLDFEELELEVDSLNDLSYEDLTEVWEDVMDTEPYVVVKRRLDAPLLSV